MEAKKKPPLMERLKDSKFFEFVKDKVVKVIPDALEIIGGSGIPGTAMIGKIGELLNNKKEESGEIRALAAEFEKYKMQWEMEMLQMQLTYDKEMAALEYADTANTRDRELGFLQQLGHIDWMMAAVGAIVFAAFIYIVIFLSNRIVPADNKEIYRDLITTIRDAAMLILAYYYGSSKGGRRMSQAITDKVTR